MKFLKAVNANNVAQVKKSVGSGSSQIPRVAVKTAWGYEDEAGVSVDIEATKQVQYIDTGNMNAVELACVRGC